MVGFESQVFTTTENVSAMVCAEIVTGSLEREVEAYLSTVSEGSAGGK